MNARGRFNSINRSFIPAIHCMTLAWLELVRVSGLRTVDRHRIQVARALKSCEAVSLLLLRRDKTPASLPHRSMWLRIISRGRLHLGSYDIWVEHGFYPGLPGVDGCAAIPAIF